MEDKTMRRHYGILATLALAYAAVGLTPATAQNQQPCCSFLVIHNFTLCLPQGCQQPQVTWNWNTQAAVWDLNNLPPTINTNSGSANYSVPSSDSKCAQAQITQGSQTCAVASACASFNVSWISGTNCLQGSHTTFGIACALCRMHGANAAANSHIVISCPNITQGTVVWTPQFQDFIGGECGVQMYDPVIVRYRNIRTGDTREEVLFELSASNFQWEPNGDGATARGGPKSTPKTGHITLMKARMAGGSGQESRIHIRWDDNMIVTEAEATGEFSDWQLPNVGDTMPLYDDGGIQLPGVFDLPFEAPNGWVVEGIEMGGGGVSGQDIPRTPGDVDGNGCVDDADLLQVLFAFGGQGGAADVNGDGIVDDADLLIVLFNFGTGC
jgi:hypothetical protein